MGYLPVVNKTTEQVKSICYEVEENFLEGMRRPEFFAKTACLAHITDPKDQRALWTCLNKLEFATDAWVLAKGESVNVSFRGLPKHIKRVLWELLLDTELDTGTPVVQISGPRGSLRLTHLGTPQSGETVRSMTEQYNYLARRVAAKRGPLRHRTNSEGDTIDDRVAVRLDALRRERNIGHTAFAAMLGCEDVRLKGLLSGRIKNWRLDEIVRACAALEVEPTKLLKHTPPKKVDPGFGRSITSSPATKLDENGN